MIFALVMLEPKSDCGFHTVVELICLLCVLIKLWKSTETYHVLTKIFSFRTWL